MCNFSQTILTEQQGRIQLSIQARRIGEDILITLTGGKAHIGAVAIAAPETNVQSIQLNDHREGELAEQLAATIAGEAGQTVAVACGIHYDRITRQEIECVRNMAARLANALVKQLAGKP